MIVVPFALISRMNSHIERRISMSTPAVGSSRIRSRGSCTSARAIMSRRFMPPDSVRAMPVRLSQRCKALRYFSVRACATLLGTP